MNLIMKHVGQLSKKNIRQDSNGKIGDMVANVNTNAYYEVCKVIPGNDECIMIENPSEGQLFILKSIPSTSDVAIRKGFEPGQIIRLSEFNDASTSGSGFDSPLNGKMNVVVVHIIDDKTRTFVATIVDSLDTDYQLFGLILPLKDGWYDGKGLAYAKSDLDWVSNQLKEAMPAELALPIVVPTPEGEIQAEWHKPKINAVLTISLTDKTADWIIARRDGGEDVVQIRLDLSQEHTLKAALAYLQAILATK
jgi:hypothetical protein